MMSTKTQTVDVFQASLLNLIHQASDIGIHNLFDHKRTELYRFILCAYIDSLTACHSLRSELQEQSLNDSQTLTFRANSSIKEETLKNEWMSLLKPHAAATDTHGEEEHKSSEHDTSIASEKEKEKERDEVIDYKSIGRSCWIYIIQNYFTQKEKLSILPCLDSYFNELSSDCLVWKELSLTSYQINTNIPYYSVSSQPVKVEDGVQKMVLVRLHGTPHQNTYQITAIVNKMMKSHKNLLLLLLFVFLIF
eukprot:1150094_1